MDPSAVSGVSELSGLKRMIYNAYASLATAGDYDINLLLLEDSHGTMMTNIWDALVPLAWGLILLYFILDFMEQVTNGHRELDIKMMFLSLMKLAIVSLVLTYGKYFLSGIIHMGNTMVQVIHEVSVGTEDGGVTGIKTYWEDLCAACDDLGLIESLGLAIYAIIIEIASAIPAFMIGLHSISRRIELIIRGGMMSIAIPNLFSDGTRSGAIRYFKKYAACLAHGAVMILILKIVSALMLGTTGTLDADEVLNMNLGQLLNIFLYTFSAIGLISASKSIVNDVFS